MENNQNRSPKQKSALKKILSFIKKYSVVFIILFIFLFLYACDNFGTHIGSSIMGNLRSIATTFTPTTDLFDDGSEVSFVSYFFGMKGVSKNELARFCYPTTNQNVSSSDDFLSYNYSGTVGAVCNGKVSAVGYTKDSEKFVEIEHPEGYVSRYIGLNYVGVVAGQEVNCGYPVGLASKDKTYKVYIHKNSNLVKTSEILWQK